MIIEWRRAQEIAHVKKTAPQVVLLGAGASRAAFPNGERHGLRLPLMADFSDIVPIGKVLDRHGVAYAGENFEHLYSKLVSDKTKRRACSELEDVVYRYFDSLSLPDEPTLYDHLILSLRDKDVIATFNWDPFLIQAARRNKKEFEQPLLLFLHGNVQAGFCVKDKVHGVKNAKCSRCGARFEKSRLLYPTSKKVYDTDPMIRDAWRMLRHSFRHAFMVTVFGYSAPKTDAAAVDALRGAWGSPDTRPLEQFEIIDVEPPKKLRNSWRAFIHTHHFDTHDDPYESWMFNHPRRTGEAFIEQFLNGKFIDENPIPQQSSHAELAKWFKPLFDAERFARDR